MEAKLASCRDKINDRRCRLSSKEVESWGFWWRVLVFGTEQLALRVQGSAHRSPKLRVLITIDIDAK